MYSWGTYGGLARTLGEGVKRLMKKVKGKTGKGGIRVYSCVNMLFSQSNSAVDVDPY